MFQTFSVMHLFSLHPSGHRVPRIARVGKALCSHHITANAALQRCLLLTHPQPFLKSILPVERALPFRNVVAFSSAAAVISGPQRTCQPPGGSVGPQSPTRPTGLASNKGSDFPDKVNLFVSIHWHRSLSP